MPCDGSRTVTVRVSEACPFTAAANARNSVVSVTRMALEPSAGVRAPKGSTTSVLTSRTVHVTFTRSPGFATDGSTRSETTGCGAANQRSRTHSELLTKTAPTSAAAPASAGQSRRKPAHRRVLRVSSKASSGIEGRESSIRDSGPRGVGVGRRSHYSRFRRSGQACRGRDACGVVRRQRRSDRDTQGPTGGQCHGPGRSGSLQRPSIAVPDDGALAARPRYACPDRALRLRRELWGGRRGCYDWPFSGRTLTLR